MRFTDILLELIDPGGNPVGDAAEQQLKQGSKDPNKLGGDSSFEDIFSSGIADDPTEGSEENLDAALDAGMEDGDGVDAGDILEKVSKHPFLARDPVSQEDDPLAICGKSISELNQLKDQANAKIMAKERRKQFGTWDDEELQYLRDKVSFIAAVLEQKKPEEASE